MQVDDVFAVAYERRSTDQTAVVLPAALRRERELGGGADRLTDRLDALARANRAHVADAEQLVAAEAVSGGVAQRIARERAAGSHIAGAVAIVEEPVGLVVAQGSNVIAEGAIRRRAADVDLGLMIELRRCDSQIRGRKAGKRAGLDDLVDEPGRTRRSDRRRAAAGIDLQFL